jgi:glyceraldehyde-3-phosphate dehydrogenase (NADP+)
MEAREDDINFIFPKEEEIPSDVQMEFPIIQKEYLIDGELFEWDGECKDIYSPVFTIDEEGNLTRKLLGCVPSLTATEALNALNAALQAYDFGRGSWPMAPVSEHIRCMQNFVIGMKAVREEVVKLLMWEIGKSREDSEKEFDRTVDYIQDTIDALKNVDRLASRFEISSGIIGQIRRSPMGIVVSMGPYNYPLNETFTTLIPALIMGNCVIAKPAKFGQLLMRPLLKVFRDSFPRGVINIIYGSGSTVIGPIMETGKVNVLAFIGTSKVADILKKQHPMPHRLRGCLGLEAKNPAIIMPDADIETAVNECILGTLSFNGQRCTALKMIFVHNSIADAFIERFSSEIEKLKIGMPWEKGVKVTPLPEDGKIAYLQELIEDAKAKGAQVINPSGGLVNQSFFFPAILYPVNEDMRAQQEEQFGPIIPISPYNDIEEPIQWMIQSNYGQQVSVFGTNPEEIARLVDILTNQVCRVNINSQCQRGPDSFPFTGRKDSAESTLSITDALRVFSIRTLVAMKSNDANKMILNNIIQNRKSNFINTDFIF